jgi:hypothetical protein
MKTIQDNIEINASDETVWKILSDFASYPEWNPFIIYIEGRMRIGERLYVEMRAETGSVGAYRPTVTRVIENREFGWFGYFLMKGLCDMENIFTIKPLEKNLVMFENRGVFEGLCEPFLSWLIGKDILHSYHKMNKALKLRAEKIHNISIW